MEYEVLAVYKIGHELEEAEGYAVRVKDASQLNSVHLHDTFDEAKAEVVKRNEAFRLSQHWPSPNDPEVVALLEDEDFVTDESTLRIHAAMEAVARERAGIPR
jgi:hypothetical protein